MRLETTRRAPAGSFRRAAWLTGLVEALLAAAAVKTRGHPAVTALYILSGIAVAAALLHARRKNTPEAYRLLVNLGFAAFIADTIVCLLWTR